MGYRIEFRGDITYSGSDEDMKIVADIMDGLSATRRVKRDMSKHTGELSLPMEDYGIEGEFYFGRDDSSVVDSNSPPSSQPSLYCGWEYDTPGVLVWNYDEQASSPDGWIRYIVEKIISANNCVCNCEIEYRGDDWDDYGTIVVKNNVVDLYEMNCIAPVSDANIVDAKIRYYNPSQFDNVNTVSDWSDMSSDDMANNYWLLFYDTLNDIVADGVTEVVNQHDLDIITDLVSEVIGNENDKDGTPVYPDMFIFSFNVAVDK